MMRTSVRDASATRRQGHCEWNPRVKSSTHEWNGEAISISSARQYVIGNSACQSAQNSGSFLVNPVQEVSLERCSLCEPALKGLDSPPSRLNSAENWGLGLRSFAATSDARVKLADEITFATGLNSNACWTHLFIVCDNPISVADLVSLGQRRHP